jgi:hypothetical protein
MILMAFNCKYGMLCYAVSNIKGHPKTGSLDKQVGTFSRETISKECL